MTENRELAEAAFAEAYKEKIVKIEALNLHKHRKAELILVLLGEKPATEINLGKLEDSPENFFKTLEEVGLSFEKTTPKSKIKAAAGDWIAVAKDRDTVLKLKDLDSTKDHREYGLLMGYPASAVEAFIETPGNPKKIKSRALAESFMKEVPVVDFRLSEDNWQEELKTAQRWNDVIKKYAPDTFKEIQGIKDLSPNTISTAIS